MRIVIVLVAIAAVAAVCYPALDQVKATIDSQFGTQLASTSHAAGPHEEDAAAHQNSGHGDSHHDHAGEANGESHGEHHAKHKIVVTSPIAKDVTLTQQYVCQIHSRRHIDLCALEGGYLKSINVNEGQVVKKGDILFNILPTLYQARRDADVAEADLAQVEYDNTQKLVQQNIVSVQELKLAKAKLAKAEAQVNLCKPRSTSPTSKLPSMASSTAFMNKKAV